MRHRLVRHRLEGVHDLVRTYDALLAGHDDSAWLDSGGAGVSYFVRGVPLAIEPPVFPALADALADLHVDVSDPPEAGRPAFRLGLVGWLGYELRGETTGAAVTRSSRYPDAAFLRVDRAVAVDGRTGAAELLALQPVGTGDWSGETGDWRRATEAALRTVRVADAARPSADVPSARSASSASVSAPPAAARWRDADARYREMIAAAQAAIHDGEAYQLCLTTEVEVDIAPDLDPGDLYLRVRAGSPTHHGALLRVGGVSLVSASPERFLEIGADRVASTSPIKGTRPRDADPARDAELAIELLASEKERAENLMIVDLMRNDLSRVCEVGSVAVTQLLEVESYAQVHQLVSTVQGTLSPGITGVAAVAACFPAGSMTGAPKRRATEVLDGLEQRARGPYAGAFGYLGVDGAVDLAMTIRTIVLDGSRATVGTGGGITALSDPAAEVEETRVKAAPLLAALGAADAAVARVTDVGETTARQF